jgi:hypothetical protein
VVNTHNGKKQKKTERIYVNNGPTWDDGYLTIILYTILPLLANTVSITCNSSHGGTRTKPNSWRTNDYTLFDVYLECIEVLVALAGRNPQVCLACSKTVFHY